MHLTLFAWLQQKIAHAYYTDLSKFYLMQAQALLQKHTHSDNKTSKIGEEQNGMPRGLNLNRSRSHLVSLESFNNNLWGKIIPSEVIWKPINIRYTDLG